MSESSMTLAATLDSAAAKGLVVVFPKSNQLFLDIDTEDQYATFLQNFLILQGKEYCEYKEEPSKSGTNRHITVNLSRSVGALERILLQACLGSDPTHELLSYVAYKQGHEQPTCFFERPW